MLRNPLNVVYDYYRCRYSSDKSHCITINEKSAIVLYLYYIYLHKSYTHFLSLWFCQSLIKFVISEGYILIRATRSSLSEVFHLAELKASVNYFPKTFLFSPPPLSIEYTQYDRQKCVNVNGLYLCMSRYLLFTNIMCVFVRYKIDCFAGAIVVVIIELQIIIYIYYC